MNADRLVTAMTLMQLALVVQCAPPNRQAWTPLEVAARDEYDRRVLEAEAVA